MAPDSDNQPNPSEHTEKVPAWKANMLNTMSELSHLPLFLKRSLSSDFYQVRANEEERKRLAGLPKPITNELGQDYAAWRRGMLWITTLTIAITLGFQTYETIELMDDETQPGIIQFMFVMLLCLLAGATGLVNKAALVWDDLEKSRRYTRFAWLLLFLGPFLVWCIPIAPFMDYTTSGQRIQIGLFVSLFAALDLFPRIIGLFAGIIRASLTLKTLLPESNTPGWLAVITAPLYVLFFLVALIIAIQSTISIWLVLSFNAFILAPVMLLTRTKSLVRSVDPKDGHLVVQQIRRTSIVCVGAALIFFIIFVSTIELNIPIEAVDVFNIIASFLASVLLLTLVMSDLMMSLMIHAYSQQQVFRGSEMENALAGKVGDLSDVGLGDLDIGETELLRKIGGAAKTAGQMGKDWVSGDSTPDKKDEVIPPDDKSSTL
ncbi:MAG: hypothetical protein AAGB26_01740 [Planctomycetota bacterium]